MKKIFIHLKWGYLRWKYKRHRIGFNKMMLRMYWIQELVKLPQYKTEELAWFNYSKIKKIYMKEFPIQFSKEKNEDLHNPYKF